MRAFIALWRHNNNNTDDKKKKLFSASFRDKSRKAVSACGSERRWLRAILKKLMSVSADVVSACPSSGPGSSIAAAFIKVTWWHANNLERVEKRQHSGLFFFQPRLDRHNEQNVYAKVAVPESPPSALSGLEKKKKARKVPAMKWASRSASGALTIDSCCAAAASEGHLCLAGSLRAEFFSRLVFFRVTHFSEWIWVSLYQWMTLRSPQTFFFFARLMCTAFTVFRIKVN